ncbi:MAG: hypothetical protein RLZZ324_351 [Candidatus Parcubacteria bacterium]|jgi:hypothetical protein
MTRTVMNKAERDEARAKVLEDELQELRGRLPRSRQKAVKNGVRSVRRAAKRTRQRKVELFTEVFSYQGDMMKMAQEYVNDALLPKGVAPERISILTLGSKVHVAYFHYTEIEDPNDSDDGW